MTYYQMIIEMSNNKSKIFYRRGWKYHCPELYVCLSVCGITKDGVRKEYENIYCNNGEVFIPGKDDIEGDDWEEFPPKRKSEGLTFLEALKISASSGKPLKRKAWTSGCWVDGIAFSSLTNTLVLECDHNLYATLYSSDYFASDWEIIN